ncbi:alpha/beta fold hydrolase [Geodermatophilus tzadiensis]|nr:alpha/beta hydrolase [Geodermatophilus tzadiensis]
MTVGRENGQDIQIHFDDHGDGPPVVLIHGYPLDGRSFEKQERVLLGAGHRVITYDRRGFGRSSQPSTGYDYDTFAADLEILLETLDLSDVALVGFSMGTGEVARHFGRRGSGRVSKAVLMGSVPPFLLRTDDNPDGVDGQVFADIKRAVLADRPAYFRAFFDDFFNVDQYAGTRISDQAYQAAFATALTMSPLAAHDCVDSWLTDFRDDVAAIDVPTLLLHGDADRILPYAATAARLPALVKDLTVITVEGGPHNIAWTHPEVVNPALLEFLHS